jgi:hypothetical protein
MKIIVSKWLVPPTAVAWTLWPFIIFKDKKYMTDKILQHEKIHIEQQKELLVIPFYIIYVLNFIFNLLTFNPSPYRNILFEKEAFANEEVEGYLESRKKFAWL